MTTPGPPQPRGPPIRSEYDALDRAADPAHCVRVVDHIRALPFWQALKARSRLVAPDSPWPARCGWPWRSAVRAGGSTR